MKLIKTNGRYNLYQVGNDYELWLGAYNEAQDADKGVSVGYVSDPDNFEVACNEADEELRYLASGE
jgi:hypothetical protein